MDPTQPRIFIIAGMPRASTTFLYQRFQEHPAIYCPYRKETNFFSVTYGKGLDWYRGLYSGIAAGQVACLPAYGRAGPPYRNVQGKEATGSCLILQQFRSGVSGAKSDR